MTDRGVGLFLALMIFGGGIVSGFVMRVRAGLGVWYGLRVGDVGVVWLVTSAVCSMFWPVTLVVWLLRGRPEPRVVFNDKAREREQRQMQQRQMTQQHPAQQYPVQQSQAQQHPIQWYPTQPDQAQQHPPQQNPMWRY